MITDGIAPTITLNGESNIILKQNQTYIEAGAVVTDNVDTNIILDINGSVDTKTIGKYTLTYTATDKNANTTTVKRDVTVVESTPPVITLNGESTLMLIRGEAYIELGAVVADNIDTNLTVNISGSVDSDNVGVYQIIYSTKDSAGNESNAIRTVTVYNEKPIAYDQNITVPFNHAGYPISLLGSDSGSETLVYHIVDAPQHGNITAISKNIAFYQPDTNYSGTDSFSFKINDSIDDSANATVHISLESVVLSFGIKDTSLPMISEYDTNGSSYQIKLSSDNTKAFVADGLGGLVIFDISNPQMPKLEKIYFTASALYGLDLSKESRNAYLAVGDYGVEIVDLSSLALVGSYQTSGIATAVTLSSDQTKMYIVQNSQGAAVIDNNDSTNPTLLKTYTTLNDTWRVVLSSDDTRMYVADGSNGVVVLESLSGHVSQKLELDDAKDLALSRDYRTIYVANGDEGLAIIDSNGSLMNLKSKYDTYGTSYGVALSKDNTKVYLADGNEGIKVIDVSRVDSPTLLSQIDTIGTSWSVTLSADNKYLFIADRDAGMKVFDISKAYLKKPINFGSDTIKLLVTSKNKENLTLQIQSDNNKTIVLESNQIALDYNNDDFQEVEIPIRSVTGATGVTDLNITLSNGILNFSQILQIEIE